MEPFSVGADHIYYYHHPSEGEKRQAMRKCVCVCRRKMKIFGKREEDNDEVHYPKLRRD